MYRLLFLSLCLMYALPSCVERASAAKPGKPSAIPVLRITNDTSFGSLQIAKLQIDVTVTGNVATTVFDISFYNPADKILEGEFDFPLADGQNIFRYALDIDGHLREGVVVEKVAARVAFENTVRRKIDPGLVEKTKGNNFRTRIYPIPAKGYKRVLIGIEEPLVSVKEGLLYSLPLIAEQPIKEFRLTATIVQPADKPILQNNQLDGFSFTKDGKNWVASTAKTGFLAGLTAEFIVPEKDGQVYTETFDGNTYFYGHSLVDAQYQEKTNPSSVTLLWDVSSSSEKRDLDKEIQLLKTYFKRLDNVTVTLVPFNITALSNEKFEIKNGNAEALVTKLKSYDFDGGTQLGAINLNDYKTDEIILFTDGLSTFGKKEIFLSQTPVTVISSSSSPDYAYLKFIALQTHGRFINLNQTAASNAVDEMAKEPLQFISAIYSPDEMSEFTYQTNAQLQNGFSFAGILKKESASITLNFGFGNKIITSKKVLVQNDAGNSNNVKRMWATAKIAQLELEYEKNKQAITALGKQFSVVTQNTSLLVLDRVEDYVQYDIVPPAELQKEYAVLMKEKQAFKQDEKALAFEDALSEMRAMKEWYNQGIQKRRVSVVNTEGVADDGIISPPVERGTGEVVSRSVDNAPPPIDQLESAAIGTLPVPPPPAAPEQNKAKESDMVFMKLEEPALVETYKFTPPKIVADDEVKEDEKPMPDAVQSKIEINGWSTDAIYLKELEKTPVDKQVAKYLSLKNEYSMQPSFFVDVARFFYANENKPMALRVLSNIAEMKLENPELLRIVANQLYEFDEPALALEVFKEVLNIREEEPQSYRDLALAYNEIGNYQQAIDLLYKVVLGTWDDRFGGLKAIALNEMNAVITAHPNAVNIAAISKQFIQPMPLDVRIVIGWSSNDSDIDLWVTDPRKEKCSYQNTSTSLGGKISGDVTQGYGPEEFCLRMAKDGSYDIDVNLYGDSRQTSGGPITIKAELFTNFGKPTQQRKVINCRVTSSKEVIRIGSLQFGN
jgi:hypothetical protein